VIKGVEIVRIRRKREEKGDIIASEEDPSQSSFAHLCSSFQLLLTVAQSGCEASTIIQGSGMSSLSAPNSWVSSTMEPESRPPPRIQQDGNCWITTEKC